MISAACRFCESVGREQEESIKLGIAAIAGQKRKRARVTTVKHFTKFYLTPFKQKLLGHT